MEALQLNATTNDLVNMGNNFGFSSGDFSVEVWVKLNPGDTEPLMPVVHHYSGYGAGYFLAVNDVGDGMSASGKAHFYTGYPGSGLSSTVINDGLWHELVGVYQIATRTSSLYVDGQFQSSQSGNVINAPPAPTSFLVGGLMSGGLPTGLFTGLIDDVRIYDFALNASHVQSIYTNTLNIAH